MREQVTPTTIRKFAHNLLNKKKTILTFTGFNGEMENKMFAKIVREDNLEKENISDINYQYECEYQDVYQDCIITVPEKDIRNAKCIDCAILIGVKVAARSGITIEYRIQASQAFEVLSDNRIINGYVEKGSMRYYMYDAKPLKNGSSIIFARSDHNRQCANMYLGLVEFPGAKAAIASTTSGS